MSAQLNILGFFLLILSTRITSCFSSVSESESYAKLVNWLQEHGGRVDDRWDVTGGSITTANGVQIRGAVALTDIEVGTELLFCPWKLILGSESHQNQMTKSGDDMCLVVESMANEIRLGKDSFWYPYLSHIELPRLAADWDEPSLGELQGLDPRNEVDRHIRWYRSGCNEGDLDGATMQSLVAFISRACDVGMVPIYDLLNHHNGEQNAKLSISVDGVRLMSVGGTIGQGQEIYLSYGIKTTAAMFRDYGFVEDWPAAWNFVSGERGDNFAFVLFGDVVAISPSAEILHHIWKESMSLAEYQEEAVTHTSSLKLQDLELFAFSARSELDRLPTTLQEDEMILDAFNSEAPKQNNADTIAAVQYRMAFKRALATALAYAEAEIKMVVGQEL